MPGPASLLQPDYLWTRAEVLSRPCPIPRQAGVYAWYFDAMPGPVSPTDAHQHGDWTLLYVGISPSKPPENGRRPSSQTLAHRIRYHYRGNAEGSTLRLTLGCLLSTDLGIKLRRVGSGTRMTFGPGEATLSAWMADHARVTWLLDPTPWVLEHQLIQALALPLNLDQNRAHSFHPTLSAIRRAAKTQARALPILT
jgi:hypothetical protein